MFNFGFKKNNNTIPKNGLIFKALLKNGLVDSIGLSIAEFWVVCPVEHRTLYSADGSEWYDAATIITNIEASEYLNDGGELIGNSVVGYAQYEDGTSVAILNKALKYFKINTEMLDALELLDSLVIIGV